MKNNKSDALFSSAMMYSVFTIIIILVSIGIKNLNVLYSSIFTFLLMIASLILSIAYQKHDKLPFIFSLICFLLLLPLALLISIIEVVIFVMAFIYTIIKTIKKGGGTDE